jgi:hypothetical protein
VADKARIKSMIVAVIFLALIVLPVTYAAYREYMLGKQQKVQTAQPAEAVKP